MAVSVTEGSVNICCRRSVYYKSINSITIGVALSDGSWSGIGSDSGGVNVYGITSIIV